LVLVLAAGYQGSHVASEILLKLKHPSNAQSVLEFAVRMLDKIAFWTNRLISARETVVRKEWSEPSTEESRLAWRMIDSLKLELGETRQLSSMIMSVGPDELSEAELSWCVAQYGRQLFAVKEYWALRRAYGELSNNVADIEMSNAVAQDLFPEFGELDKLVDAILLGDESLGLRMRVLEKVKSVWRYANLALYELNIIDACFAEEITYTMLDFSDEEGREWAFYSFEPLIAGLWRSYGYSTGAEATSWVRQGWNRPEECLEWFDKRFDPLEAKEWLDLGIDSENARQWRRAGFTASKARPYIEKGMRVPPNMRR
jgi:hypothetical protein